MNPLITQALDSTSKRFDEEFAYLPPKNGEPQMYVVNDNFDAAKAMESISGGSIQVHAVDGIKPLDNLDVRNEIKSFLLQSNLELLAAVREMFENSNWEKEFDFQFVVPNQGSKTGFWWKVPPVGVSEEYASPVEVKKFIRHFFITALSEGNKNNI